MGSELDLATGIVRATFFEGVSGQYENGDPIGIPIVGVTVKFTPDLEPPIVRNVDGAPATVLVEPVLATTNSNGELVQKVLGIAADSLPTGVPLIATFDDNINPSGWTWTATLSAPGLETLSITFMLSADEDLDLARVVPAPSSSGNALVEWRAAVISTEAAAIAANASATYAAQSATTASTAATQAGISAGTAATARDAASTSAKNASDSATAAATSASQASGAISTTAASAKAAADSATAADTSRIAAAGSASAASSASTDAVTAKNAAVNAQTAAETASTAATTAQTNAAGSATAAGTSATNAAASAATAATQAETASTAASTATSQATIATTQAGQAATSATQAATSATTASDKAAAAATSAGNAAGSATAAAASQGVAGTSADTASTAATNAEASRSAAQDILTSFNTAKGVPNGFAILDGTGKLPASALPSSVIEFKGTWDATTNTPHLEDGAGDIGDFYTVAVAGTRDLGSGPIDFNVRDQVIRGVTKFEKIDNTDSVTSVAGRQGAVTLTKSDVGLSNVDNTSDMNKPVSTAAQNALNDTVNGATIVGRALILQKIGGGTTSAGTIVPSLGIGIVTTGDPGTQATATITGTAPDQSLNLTIPTGQPGPSNLIVGTVNTLAPGQKGLWVKTDDAGNVLDLIVRTD